MRGHGEKGKGRRIVKAQLRRRRTDEGLGLKKEGLYGGIFIFSLIREKDVWEIMAGKFSLGDGI